MSGPEISVRRPPPLDPGYLPAVMWTDAYMQQVSADPGSGPLIVCVTRPDGTVFRHETSILPHSGANVPLNLRHVERAVKLLLWMKGGSEVIVAGHDALVEHLAAIYRPGGERTFDVETVGRRIFRSELTVRGCQIDAMPDRWMAATPLGRHLEGCRIGFDLGGSDRKCAAVRDGEVVHSEEVEWNPYFESDPRYHLDGIRDSLARAGRHLPRVDAIGGSAAGVYVDNEPRVASLFRGISEEDFERHIRPVFRILRREWGGVPFEVVNDGEVTALAASMRLEANSLLGISLGTSMAAGYCDQAGRITSRLNELAFVPVDYRDDAPVDEWSGDRGCGVQYFSQQAVARLAPAAGFEFDDDVPLAERLKRIQMEMAAGDDGARAIYATIGCYLGYAIAWYDRWYDLQNLLILGRVTSGPGGEVILSTAGEVLAEEFPEVAARVRLSTPDEQFKRHGQAIAAASLPRIDR